MWCSTCQSVMPAHDELAVGSRCPDCGGALDDEAQVVQIEQADRADRADRAERAERAERALVVRRQPEATFTLFERVTALRALAWSQPAVRSAVKTGAGAVALALVARAARSWLAGPRRRRGATESLLPAIADALRSPQSGPQIRPRARAERESDEGALVVETFIYARRVMRR